VPVLSYKKMLCKLGNIYDDGQVEEELTAAEVLAKLEEAWLNEKHSPELLEPKMEVSKSSLFLSLAGEYTVLYPVGIVFDFNSCLPGTVISYNSENKICVFILSYIRYSILC
jgi:hypothetical protein